MMKNIHSLYTKWQVSRQQNQHRLAQGRLTTNEAATILPDSGEMPLVRLPTSHDTVPTIFATEGNRGHLLIVAPPGSVWQEQLILTLTGWPGPALVVDPDGKLYQQTGTIRQNVWGAVYPLPGYRLRANSLLRFWQPEVAFQLHQFLIPETLLEPGSLVEVNNTAIHRTVALFCAAGLYSFAKKCNPFQLLLDLALTDMLTALAALETVPQARLYVRHFTKGQPPQLAIYDEATVEAFSWFSHQLWRYQGAYNIFATPEENEAVVPEKWSQERGTIYLTYTPSQQVELRGLVAALVSSQLVAHQTYGDGQPLLLVLDATLASRLPHFAQLLETAADYGITIVLTTPALTTLDGITSMGSGQDLTGQFAHQLWYPPRDRTTAGHMTWRFGTRLNKAGEKVPVVTAEEMMAWPNDQLLLVTQRERPYCIMGQPVNLPEDFPQRKPPLPPTSGSTPRTYNRWLPELPDLTQQVAEVLIAKGVVPVLSKMDDGKNEDGQTTASNEPDSEITDASSSKLQEGAIDETDPLEEGEEETEKSLTIVRTKFR